MLKALCLSVWLGLSLVSGAQAASVVFLNPGNADETFWVSYSRFMQGAAQNLGMSLRVEYSGRDRQRVLHQARQALQGPQRPDYLVLVNEQYVAPEIIRLSRGSGVRLFLVNNGLTVDQARQVHAEWPRHRSGRLTRRSSRRGTYGADRCPDSSRRIRGTRNCLFNETPSALTRRSNWTPRAHSSR